MRISKDYYEWDEGVPTRPEGGLMFAYGANIGTEDMEFRCPTATPLMPARLDGWRLSFKGCATVEVAEDWSTHGNLWLIKEKDEAVLDAFEGVHGGFYHKHLLPVTAENGHTVTALVYIMTERIRSESLPAYHYFDNVQRGYVEWGLPLEALDNAFQRAKMVSHA